MSTLRKKMCPACHCVCEHVDSYCQQCHTSLYHAREIDIPAPLPTYQPHPGERLIVVPPSSAHVDEEYLNLFKRPVLYRTVPNYHHTPVHQRLSHRAVRYQRMGLMAFFVACCACGWSFVMTVSVFMGWRFGWMPPPALTDVLVPLGYALTILQLGATYTAFCARDHALYLADMHQKSLAS
ncbi:MAG: hypothetical protein ACK5GU_03315 [Chloroflexota bacterium]|jgi:hypothetical protein